MAFPSGYTKYQEVTIDNTKVSADLTDYIVYIDLAELVKAGADIFDTCRTDGVTFAQRKLMAQQS